MLADRDSNINRNIDEVIYIRLLNEGTQVFRPVPSRKIGLKTFIVGGDDIYDPDDEEWEFVPGTTVLTGKRKLDGEDVLVAVSKV